MPTVRTENRPLFYCSMENRPLFYVFYMFINLETHGIF